MEYDKFLVSLYEDGNHLPKMFVEVQKRSEIIVVTLFSQTLFKGVLFLFSEGKVVSRKVEKGNISFKLDKVFDFNSSYLFCFLSKNNIYTGERGWVLKKEKVVDYFKSMYHNLETKTKQEQELSFDKNCVIGRIVDKVFGDSPPLFFEQTEKQLSAIFSMGKRAYEVEKLIPYSKFVVVGNDDERFYVGVVYKNNSPFAIALGFNGDSTPQNDGLYQCFYKEGSQLNMVGESYTFFFSFRSAIDCDFIWLK